MNSRDYLLKRHSDFYDEIDTQINQLSSCSLISLESADMSYLKKPDVASKNEIQNVIKAAKEFDVEFKKHVKKTEQDEKKRKIRNRAQCMSYNIPPIWDDNKLGKYIDNVLNGFDFDIFSEHFSEDEEEEKPVRDSPKAEPCKAHHPKSILKRADVTRDEKKRNVGTNVKFDSPSNVQKQQQPSTTKEKKKDKSPCKKKCQAIKANDREIKSFPTSGTSMFADKSERDSNDEKKLQVAKTNRPQSAPSKLVFAPITLTSTTSEAEKCHDIVMLAESNLATSSERHMTSCFLPTLSIKGKCNIQRIYQLEILPTTSDLQLNEQCRAKNVHFYEYIYEPPPPIQQRADCEIMPDLKANRAAETKEIVNAAVHTQTSTINIQSRALTSPHMSTPLKHDEISATLSNLKSILDDIKISNGKIEVVVKRTNERKRKIPRKKLRQNFPTKSTQVRAQKKATKVLKFSDKEENSDSSSLTDKNVARDFLGYEKKKVEEETHESGGDPSSPTSVPIKNGSNDSPETSLNNNFKSFYELFEKTFEESTKRVEHAVEKKKEANTESDLLRIKEIISMSEENIKKAGEILQKYQKERAEVSQQTSNINVLKGVEVSMQTSEINVPEKFSIKPLPPPESSPTKVDSCVQTICDKYMQTDGYKSRHYFKHVYDKFSNLNDINFHQPPSSRPYHHLPPQHQSTATTPSLIAKYLNDTDVPFNPVYSGNDEVLEMAQRFLRSIEKRKKSSISGAESSSEISSIDINVERERSVKSLSNHSSRRDKKEPDEKEESAKLKESNIADLLSGLESSSDSDDSSSISSSILNF